VSGLRPLRADVDDSRAAPVVGDVGGVPGAGRVSSQGDLLALVGDELVEALDGAPVVVAGSCDDLYGGLGQLCLQGGDLGGGFALVAGALQRVGEVALAGLRAGDERLDRLRLGLDYVDNRVASSASMGAWQIAFRSLYPWLVWL
jgi:hypothetical protein